MKFYDGTESAKDEIEKSLKRALTAGAIIMEGNIISETPVGDTGMLKGSNTHSVNGLEAEVSNSAVYAPRVNYGFKGADILGRVFNQPPNPFFLRGAKSSEGPISGVLQKELGKPMKVDFRETS